MPIPFRAVQAMRAGRSLGAGAVTGAAIGMAVGAPVAGAAVGAAMTGGMAAASRAAKVTAGGILKAGGVLGAGAAGLGAAVYPFFPAGEFADPEDYMLSAATQMGVLTGPIGIGAAAGGGIVGGGFGAAAGRGFGKTGRFAAVGALAGAALGWIGTGRYTAEQFARETPTRFRGRGGVGILGGGLASSSIGQTRIGRFDYFSTGQFNGMGY